MLSFKGIGAAALSIVVIFGVHAGDLNPPGAPSPTPGPEPRIAINSANTPGDDVAFFRITQRGSYYLERDLTNHFPTSVKNGIVIEADDVTIDLMLTDRLELIQDWRIQIPLGGKTSRVVTIQPEEAGLQSGGR